MYPLIFSSKKCLARARASLQDYFYITDAGNYSNIGRFTLSRIFTQLSAEDLDSIQLLAINRLQYEDGKVKAAMFRFHMPQLRFLYFVRGTGLHFNKSGSADLCAKPISLRPWVFLDQDDNHSRSIFHNFVLEVTEEFCAEKLAHPDWKRPKIRAFNIECGGQIDPLDVQN